MSGEVPPKEGAARTWGALVGAWVVVAAYAWVMRPVWFQSFAGLGASSPTWGPFDAGVFASNALSFALAVLWTLAALNLYGAWGGSMIRLAGLRGVPWPVAFALGAVAWAALPLALGLCGLWYLPLLRGAFLAAASWAAWRTFGAWRRGAFPSLRSRWAAARPRGWGEGCALALTLPLPLFALALGAVPDLQYDARVYHLAVPEEWLLRHGLTDLGARVFSHFPYLGEFVLLPSGWMTSPPDGGVWGTSAPRLTALAGWCLAAWLAGSWASEWAGKAGGSETGRSAAWTAAILTLACPLLAINAWYAQVEGLLALFALAFLYAVHRMVATNGEGRFGWALAAGVLGGACVAVKYNGVLAWVVALAFLPLLERRRAARTLAWMGAGVVLVFLPWALKNWVFTGDPVYPYLASWFDGRSLTPEGWRQMIGEQREWAASTVWEYLALPWRLVSQEPNSYNFTGPLALVAALGLAFTRRESPGTRALAWGCAAAFAGGLCVTHLLRFESPLLPPLFTAVAVAAAVRPALRKAGPFLIVCAGIVTLPVYLGIGLYYNSPQGVWTGREDLAAYAKRSGVNPTATLAEELRRAFTPDERVLLCGEARSLGFGLQTETPSVFDEPPLVSAARDEKDADGIRRRLTRLGVDGLAVNITEGLRLAPVYGWYRLDAASWRRLDSFVSRWCDLVGGGDGDQLYRLRKVPAAGREGASLNDGLIFLDPDASAYIRAVRSGDAAERDRALASLRERQGFNPQWEAEQATWWAGEGRGKEALESWRRADALGRLSREQYAAWAAAARREGRGAEAAFAEREEKKFYGGVKASE